METIKILKDQEITFWAKKDGTTYSRNVKALLDHLGIAYEYEDKDAVLSEDGEK